MKPLSQSVTRQESQVHHDYLVCCFRLSVRLRMEAMQYCNYTRDRRNSSRAERADENGITITNNRSQQAVEPDHLVEEHMSHRGRRVRMGKWHEMSVLRNRSTTMRMTDLPLMRRTPSTKSIAMSAHTVDGIGNGWRRPPGRRCSVLLRWHTS